MEEDKRIRFGCLEFDTHLRVAQLLQRQKVRANDLALLMQLASCLDNTNRITLAMRTVAEKFERNAGAMGPSKRRLEDAGLLVRAYDPERCQAFYLIHPGFASVGDGQQRAIAWRRWQDARRNWEEKDAAPREAGERRPLWGRLERRKADPSGEAA